MFTLQNMNIIKIESALCIAQIAINKINILKSKCVTHKDYQKKIKIKIAE